MAESGKTEPKKPAKAESKPKKPLHRFGFEKPAKDGSFIINFRDLPVGRCEKTLGDRFELTVHSLCCSDIYLNRITFDKEAELKKFVREELAGVVIYEYDHFGRKLYFFENDDLYGSRGGGLGMDDESLESDGSCKTTVEPGE